jgi:hypothetical protein
LTAIFVSFTNMATYVYDNGWRQLTGTDRPYVYDGTNWQGVKEIYAYDNSAWRQVYQYDNTGPTIASLSAVDTTAAFNTNSGMQRVTWGAITDAGSGVASATLSRWFYQYDGNYAPVYQTVDTYSISTSLGGSYLDLSVPINRRKQGSGQDWYAQYSITSVDNAGNSSTVTIGAPFAGIKTTTYDVTAPSVSPPTSSPNGSDFTVSWGAITDGGMGVDTVYIHPLYYGTSSGLVAGTRWKIPSGSFGGGSTTLSVPLNKRNTPGGETWVVTYYIIATDAAGNSYQTGGSANKYTRPYGTYNITANASSSYDTTIPRWFPTDFVNPYDVRAGGGTNYYQGYFFYGDKLANACLGFEPDNATLFAQRRASQGNSGTYRFAPASNTSQPGGAPNPNAFDVVDVSLSGSDVAVNVPIINFVTNISSGSIGSIALLPVGTGSTSFRQMYGAGQGYLGLGGRVTLSFN